MKTLAPAFLILLGVMCFVKIGYTPRPQVFLILLAYVFFCLAFFVSNKK